MTAGSAPLPAAEEAAHARAADLMEALVAAYALMAHSDGEVSSAERRRIFAILREHPAMSVFSREQIANEVAEHEANFRYDTELAQQIAREKLAPIAASPRGARQVVEACRTLIPADGVAHPAEYRMLARIKSLLGIDPAGLSPFRQSAAAAA